MGKTEALRPLLTAGVTAWDGLLAALLSPQCVVCEEIVSRIASGAMCDACWRTVSFITEPVCGRCGDPLPTGRSPGTCACGQLPTHIAHTRALGFYEGTLRGALHALKYDGRRSIAPRLAHLLVERCGSILRGADAVVPVPLHWRRQWTRGFNQAEEIARHLPLPVWRVVRRVRHTPAQTALSAAARTRNLHAAFEPRRVRYPSRVAGRCVVLLDDVSTTGATLNACAAVLASLGAREIRTVTVARTPERRLARDSHTLTPEEAGCTRPDPQHE
jgi:ComF family protein